MINTTTTGSPVESKPVISSEEIAMNLHELKIWIDGFQSALKDGQPSKEQWKAVIDKIQSATDASTKSSK